VTILPNKEGSIGGVVVRTDGVVVLLDKAYATALVEGPGRTRSGQIKPSSNCTSTVVPAGTLP
jgi:hypothetical protein